ncbi:hypothetical protein K749_02350 [Helicobacter pylori UM299]|uniref:hypothetical protein n=1 Tax=Helicobacter pylori TaxID=210 RepID=UPI00032990AB|nr:hypothetical protein [Helicobacter pylori]AGL67319.1 hypothetical protein K747_07730 [Helicobacter pylori UM032]AGL67857.1 hypothetical protein K749_02350 [Helicobacter pylori UM299]AGR63217.1 hypothetical protein K748_00805 [Helicobacter pylori UM298]
MKQKVHSVSYLAKAEFEVKNGVYDLVALPSGAEVVKVSLEVAGNPMAGNISVGFKDESTKDYFLKLENVSTSKLATSAKDYTATSNKVVVAEVKTASGDGAKGVLRVLYFLPSMLEVEY